MPAEFPDAEGKQYADRMLSGTLERGKHDTRSPTATQGKNG